MMPRHDPNQDVTGPTASTGIPRVGVSACLLGQAVRYDGGDKRETVIADVLPCYVELVPVCPEVAIGLGVPREPIRLEGAAEALRAIGVNNRQLDVTERLQTYGREMATTLGDLSGYIFKSKSPSCGLHHVKRYSGGDGQSFHDGVGLYAAEIMRAIPLMPATEEGALGDSEGRENFVERVFAYHRWQSLLRDGVTPERLLHFHAAHKLILLAHSREHLIRLGQLLAAAGERPLDELVHRYGELFMQALARPATRQRHADVLYHLLSYLKRRLDHVDKAELLELIEAYRLGQLPRLAPLALFRHHFRRHPHPYIEQQLYLTEPYVA